MHAKNSSTSDADRLVEIEHIFAAPPQLVFDAWSDADHLMRWFAPDGCTITFCNLRFQVGGELRCCIRTPDGHDCWTKSTYKEILPPHRLVFTMGITDEHGTSADPASRGMDPEWPMETVVTVTFAEHDAGTKLTLHQTVLESLAKRTGAHPSWIAMLDRLALELSRAQPKGSSGPSALTLR